MTEEEMQQEIAFNKKCKEFSQELEQAKEGVLEAVTNNINECPNEVREMYHEWTFLTKKFLAFVAKGK